MRDAERYAAALRPLLPRAAGYARAILRGRREAEDAVQQAALRGWERIGQYDEARPFAGWWFAILRNCCRDMLRAMPPETTVAAEEPRVAADEQALDRRALAIALSKVTEEHREILRLRYHGELGYAEIAQALGLPAGTVMSRLHLARKALAAHLEERP